MKKRYIMSLDQGTTSSRCIIFDKNGNIVSSAQKEFPQIYPNPGWVEHNPDDIISTQIEVMLKALAVGFVDSGDIAAIGVANQRETTIIWNKNTGRPIYNAIVWQCRRTADYCSELKSKGHSDSIYQKTGLILDAYFSASKIRWILDNVDGARKSAEQGELLFGTVDTFLLWHLTEGKVHSTDYTNASRTMLFNIKTLKWDDELLELFGIPKQLLPKVFPSCTRFGELAENIIGTKIPITAIMGDQQSSLFGQLCLDEGEIKSTYGTGCFMLMNTGEKLIRSKNGLISTLIATANDRPLYALEGSVFIGGAVVQWLRDELKMIESSGESEKYANSVENTNGVYFVPAFVGLGAPHWDSCAKGILTGITRGVKKEHFVRAALESIAYQVNDILKAMQDDCGITLSELSVDGGASENNFLMQFQSDISDAIIKRQQVSEVTALGACYLAGLAVAFWKDVKEIKSIALDIKKFEPKMNSENREKLLNGWFEAVKKAKTS